MKSHVSPHNVPQLGSERQVCQGRNAGSARRPEVRAHAPGRAPGRRRGRTTRGAGLHRRRILGPRMDHAVQARVVRPALECPRLSPRPTPTAKEQSMSYEGQAVKVLPLDGGLVELRFDLQGDSVNKFGALDARRAEEGGRGHPRPQGPAGRPDHERQGRLLRRRRRDRVPRPLPEERGGARPLAPRHGRRSSPRSRTSTRRRWSPSTASPSAAASSCASPRATARCPRRRRSVSRRRSSASSPAGAAPCGSPASAGPTPRSSGSPAASRGRPRTRSRSARWTRRWRPPTCARRPSAC